MPAPMPTDVSNVIVQALDRGLTRDQISGVVGVSKRAISRIKTNLSKYGTARPPPSGVKHGRPISMSQPQAEAALAWMAERHYVFYVKDLTQHLKEHHGFNGCDGTVRRALVRVGFKRKLPTRRSEVTAWDPPVDPDIAGAFNSSIAENATTQDDIDPALDEEINAIPGPTPDSVVPGFQNQQPENHEQPIPSQSGLNQLSDNSQEYNQQIQTQQINNQYTQQQAQTTQNTSPASLVAESPQPSNANKPNPLLPFHRPLSPPKSPQVPIVKPASIRKREALKDHIIALQGEVLRQRETIAQLRAQLQAQAGSSLHVEQGTESEVDLSALQQND